MEIAEVQNDDIIAIRCDATEALKLYGEHFGVNSQDLLGKFPWTQPQCSNLAYDQQEDSHVRQELQEHLATAEQEKTAKTCGRKLMQLPEDYDEDSDGEQFQLCHLCKLPLGHAFCQHKDKYIHSECVEQAMINDVREQDEARMKTEREQKQKRHDDYGIGWGVECIPRNDAAAKKLAMRDVPQGMVCIVLNEETQDVRLASTLSPAAAINLEYLLTALKVRRTEGTEPVFSLDPVSPDANAMQVKKYKPEWLAGTRAGEVLFQSDYHLKELSMGEYDQPVVGMKSCFDISEMEQDQSEWSAREWFMVRKAEVHISEQSVLLPYVRMGVEAREQVTSGRSLEDKKVTRPDHPMVLYAESFTKNFDLIAERKSVVFHLRELAKASVMAKYMHDAKVNIDESWYDAATFQDAPCSLEVPQLWNERMFGKMELVQMQNGSVGTQQMSRMHGIYGGVQFGLDKFNLAKSRGAMPLQATVSARAPSATLSGAVRRQGLARFAPGQLMKGVPSLATSVAPGAAIGASMTMPARHRLGAMAPLMGRPMAASIGAQSSDRLQGVDLRLDSFDLSEAKRVSLEAQEGSWNGQLKSLDECVAIGTSFWSSLDTEEKIFKDEDCKLLKAIFDPKLTDRRSERELFSPPDASHTYVARLRQLVKEEEGVRQRRKEEFFSQNFDMDQPSSLFPLSWKAAFESSTSPKQCPRAALTPRPDYKDKAAELLQSALRGNATVFEKSTEEGLRFRIYSLGVLEVRTAQEVDGEEIVGAVFSTQPLPKTAGSSADIDEHQRVTKATLYVERAGGCIKTACPSACRRYFMVVETVNGQRICMELQPTGAATLELEPADLDDRISLAKALVPGAECKKGLCIGDMKSFQQSLTRQGVAASSAVCKRHAQKLFTRATGISAPRPYQAGKGVAFGLMASSMASMPNGLMGDWVAKCRQLSQQKANIMQAQFSKR
jgi:hypothetical protein